MVSSSSREPAHPARAAFDVFVDCFNRGVLARVTGDIIALSPPLIIEKQQIDELVGTISTARSRRRARPNAMHPSKSPTLHRFGASEVPFGADVRRASARGRPVLVQRPAAGAIRASSQTARA